VHLSDPCDACDRGLVDGLPCSRCGGYGIVLTGDGRDVAKLLLALGVKVPAAREPIDGWTVRVGVPAGG
jgi:hypothetical protein